MRQASRTKTIPVQLRLGSDMLKFYMEWAKLAGVPVEVVVVVALARQVLQWRKTKKK